MKKYVKVSTNLLKNKKFLNLSFDAKMMFLCIYDWVESIGKFKNGAKIELLPDTDVQEPKVIKAMAKLESAGFITEEE